MYYSKSGKTDVKIIIEIDLKRIACAIVSDNNSKV